MGSSSKTGLDAWILDTRHRFKREPTPR